MSFVHRMIITQKKVPKTKMGRKSWFRIYDCPETQEAQFLESGRLRYKLGLLASEKLYDLELAALCLGV